MNTRPLQPIKMQLDYADLHDLLMSVEGINKRYEKDLNNVRYCLRWRLGFDTVCRGVYDASTARRVTKAIRNWQKRLKRERHNPPTVGEKGAAWETTKSV